MLANHMPLRTFVQFKYSYSFFTHFPPNFSLFSLVIVLAILLQVFSDSVIVGYLASFNPVQNYIT